MLFTAHQGAKRVPSNFGVLAIAIAVALMIAFLPALPEPRAFKALVDERSFFGIPNFMNVVSNLAFLVVGVWALIFLRRRAADGKVFANAHEQWPYLTFFFAVTLTSFGSIYYHLETTSTRLFWDRLPMAIGFMAVFSAVIVERIDARLGLRLLIPLVLLGMASVLFWRWSLAFGNENVLPYALVQYGSLAAILLICAVYRSRYTRSADTVHAVAIYGFAKVLEILDARIYALGEIVSGHTLKHLTAALAVYWLLRMLRARSPR